MTKTARLSKTDITKLSTNYSFLPIDKFVPAVVTSSSDVHRRFPRKEDDISGSVHLQFNYCSFLESDIINDFLFQESGSHGIRSVDEAILIAHEVHKAKQKLRTLVCGSLFWCCNILKFEIFEEPQVFLEKPA